MVSLAFCARNRVCSLIISVVSVFMTAFAIHFSFQQGREGQGYKARKPKAYTESFGTNVQQLKVVARQSQRREIYLMPSDNNEHVVSIIKAADGNSQTTLKAAGEGIKITFFGAETAKILAKGVFSRL